jgi:myo-inositol-1(or 4)-monophosphatase
MHTPDADLELAVQAARAAGAIVMPFFGTDLAVEHKAPGQPLTEADLAADDLLRGMLGAARPEYGWLSEESRDHPDRLSRRRVWIVDPIDGTRSFIAGRPEFAISIGLVEDGAVVLGVVYNPVRDRLYRAVRGAGAYLARDGGPGERLLVSSRPERARMLASRSEIAAGEFDPFDEWTVEPVGSTAYKLARVAAGHGEAFVSRGPKSEWDICAGVLLVAEAGGRATDLDGGEPRFNGRDPYVHGIVATNAVQHDALLRRMQELPAPERLRLRTRDPLHPGLSKEDE